MLKFKTFVKTKKRTGVVPMPIHFKHVGGEHLTEAIDWLNKNDNTHLKRRESYQKQLGGLKVTLEQRKAICAYTRDSNPINTHLMGKSEKPNKVFTDKIPHLDEVIKNNPLKTKLHTYSALGFDPTKHVDNDGKLHSPAYISATPSKDSMMMFVKKHKDGIVHIAHFHLNEGDPATHIAEHSESPHEEETLIARGVTLQHHGFEDHTFEDHTDGHTKFPKFRIHKLSIVR